MNDKERIEQLEARVAEFEQRLFAIEMRPYIVGDLDVWGVTFPDPCTCETGTAAICPLHQATFAIESVTG